MDKYITMLDKIEPTSYVLNSDESESRHIGYIAQKVWLAMKEAGLEESDFAVAHSKMYLDNHSKILHQYHVSN